MNNKAMGKSDLAYTLSHITQDLAIEVAENERLEQLVKDKDYALKKAKDRELEAEKKSQKWIDAYYNRINEMEVMRKDIIAKCAELGYDATLLFENVAAEGSEDEYYYGF